MKQSELAKKYGITPQKVGRIRKFHTIRTDFCEKTKTLKPSGILKIENYLKKQDDAILEPQFVDVVTLSRCPNHFFWFCKRLSSPKKKVVVAIPTVTRDAMRPNHKFKAQVINKNGEDFYRHEDLYKREESRKG